MGSIIKVLLYKLRFLPISLWLFKIGPYTLVDRRYISIIGKKYIEIGKYCRIQAGLRLEAIDSYAGKKFKPQIIFEDNVCINQNFHCTCASLVKIGKGTSITANCGIFDIVHPYTDITKNPREQEIQSVPVIIGENCLIGMNSVILPGVNLGKHVIVGANSVVHRGFYDDYCVLVGAPARIVRKYDKSLKKWIKVDEDNKCN